MDIKQEYQKLVLKFILLVFYILNIKLMKKIKIKKMTIFIL